MTRRAAARSGPSATSARATTRASARKPAHAGRAARRREDDASLPGRASPARRAMHSLARAHLQTSQPSLQASARTPAAVDYSESREPFTGSPRSEATGSRGALAARLLDQRFAERLCRLLDLGRRQPLAAACQVPDE